MSEEKMEDMEKRIKTLETELEDVKTRCTLTAAVIKGEAPTEKEVSTESINAAAFSSGEETHVESTEQDSTEEPSSSEAEASDSE